MFISSRFFVLIQIKKLLQIVNLLRRFCICCFVCLIVRLIFHHPSSAPSTQHCMLSQFSKRKTIHTFKSSPSGELERGCFPFFSLNVLNPDKEANEDVILRWEFTHNLSFTGSDATVQRTVSTYKAFLLTYLISSIF